MSADQIVASPYTPRRQLRPIHERPERFKCIIFHRQGGKTTACIEEAIRMALHVPNANIGYFAPSIKQARDIAWGPFKKAVAHIPLLKKPHESYLEIKFFNGSQIKLYGARETESSRGLKFHLIIMDEPADMPANFWPVVIRPTLIAYQGAAIFIGTPKGKNAFYELYQRACINRNWFTMLVKASESGIIPQAELDEMRLDMTDAQYNQELECDFQASIEGAYFAHALARVYLDERLGDVPHDPGHPVYTSWDLGLNHHTAIWFWQPTRMGLRVINFYQNRFKDLPHYIDFVKSQPYVYEEHILPHDAHHHRLGQTMSIWEQMEAYGLKVRAAENVRLDDGIAAINNILDKCYFDKKCIKGLEALENYRVDYNASRDVFKNRPVDDKFSDAVDAFRYGAVTLPSDAGRYTVADREALRAKYHTAIME
jgi:hypothetical protein